jgi:hypothetical protein
LKCEAARLEWFRASGASIMRVRKIARSVSISCLALAALAAASDRRIHGTIPAGSVPSFAGNPQHTALYQPTVPDLNRIRWSATIDFNNAGALAHYGAPLVTAANTVIGPVKIANDAFRVPGSRRLAPNDDREAGLIRTLAPGQYTALLSRVNNSIGIGLVEMYDLSQ